ncbi:MAG: hypothetical protein AAB871_02905, partial [Patescibacteria group bacterium]
MNKKYLPVVAVIVVILAIFAVFQWKNWSNRGTPPEPPSNISAEVTGNKPSNNNGGQVGTNQLVGMLKKSDDAKRGNLLIQTVGSSIYIHTSRDYSALLDKEVTA